MSARLFHIIYNLFAVPLLAVVYGILALFHRKAGDRFRHTRRSHTALRSLHHRNPLIWFHAASMGEFEQAKPVIEVLKRGVQPPEIVVSFSSPSGYNPHRHYAFADAVVYVPFDSWFAQRRFIKAMQPNLCVVIRYDLWWNMTWILRSASVPLLLINATASRSPLLQRWPLRTLYRTLLMQCSTIVAADDREAQTLEKLCERSVVHGGDTRYDRICAVVDSPLPSEPWFEATSKHDDVVLVAGSMWLSDARSLLIDGDLLERFPRLRLIIVPHEIDEHTIVQWEQRFPDSQRLSALRSSSSSSRHVLVDTMGELLHIYRYADVAYVGGGFGTGVHSVAEPAAYGIPVACGPRTQKSVDVARLLQHNGCEVLHEPYALVAWLKRFMHSEARQITGHANALSIRAASGWHEKTASMIMKHLHT